MDAEVVQMVETEVLVRGSSGADLNLDSSPRQVEDREYESHVVCERPPLHVQLYAKGVDQGLEYEPGSSVAEYLEDRAHEDVHELDTHIKDIEEAQQAASTEATESPGKQEVGQGVVEKMDAKAVPILRTEALDVSIGGSSGEDLGSGQGGDRECADHVAYEQLPLPVNSIIHVDPESEYEPRSSVREHVEHIIADDFHEVDTKMEDVKGVQEEGADTVADDLPREQVVQELVSEQMNAKVIPTAEKEVPDVSLRGILDLDSCPRQAEDLEYEKPDAYEQPPSPLHSVIKCADQRGEYESGSSLTKHPKHRTAGDSNVVDTKMEDVMEVQEESSYSEAIELSKEQEADQELVSEKMGAKSVISVEKEVIDDSIRGSPDLDFGSRKAGDGGFRAHAAFEQLPLPVQSSRKGGDHGEEYEPGCSMAEHLEHRTTCDNHEVDTEMECLKEVQEEAANTEAGELHEEQKSIQVLVSENIDAKLAPNVEEKSDVLVGGCLDLLPTPAVDRGYGDLAVYEQLPSPAKSPDTGVDQVRECEPGSPVSSCLRHGLGDFPDVDTEMEDAKRVLEEAAYAEAAELCKEQEVSQKLISENSHAKVVTVVGKEVPDVSIGGSPDIESCPRPAGSREFEDHAAYEQPSSAVKSIDNGDDHGQEYESGSSVVKCLERKASGDAHEVDADMEDVKEKQPPMSVQCSVEGVDHGLESETSSLVAERLINRASDDVHEFNTNTENVKEVLEHATSTEAVDLSAELAGYPQLVCEEMDLKIALTIGTEVPNVSIRGSPVADLGSGPKKVGDGEYGDHVAHELDYEPGSALSEHLGHGAAGDAHEVDTKMANIQEAQEQVANTGTVTLPEEVDQELVFRKMDVKKDSRGETGVPDVSTGGNTGVVLDSCPGQVEDKEYRDHAVNELDSGPRQVENREYADPANCEKLPLPAKSSVELVNHRLEYAPPLAVVEHLERNTEDDVHEVNTNIEDVQEMQEDTGTVAVESPEEQQDQENEPASSVADHLEHRTADDVHEVDTNIEYVQEMQEEDAGTEAETEEQQDQENEPASSVAEHLEHRTNDDVHELDTNIGDVQEMQEESAGTEAVESTEEQEDQEYEPASAVAEHLERRTTDDVHEVDTNIEDVQEMQEEGAVTVAVESPEEQEDQEYEPASSVAEHLERRTEDDVHEIYTEIEDVQEMQEEGPSTRAVDSSEEQEDEELEPASLVVEHLERRTEDHVHEVDTIIEDVQEMQEEGASTRTVESPEEQEVQEHEPASLVAEHLEHGTEDDVHEADTIIEDVQEMQEGGAGTEAVESPEGQEDQEYELASSVAEHLEHSTADDVHEVDTDIEDGQEMQEEGSSAEAIESPEEQKDQDVVFQSAKSRIKEEKNGKRASLKSGSLMKDHRVNYQLVSENEGEFAVFDLVWGKVKSHPWWPGQIFHPSDSSEKAMKYYRKDCYLVAYFGDRTFAWNEASVLKPFRNHFPQAERQNKSEAFQNAVSCALEEVARRVELGLACSCLSEETYDKIKYQIVENTGIREESSKREGVDRSTGADSFQPDKLIEYVRALAVFPTSGVDRLEIVVAKAQLLAFNRLKGCDSLSEFQYYEGLVEHDADTLVWDQGMLGENEQADSVTGVDAKKGPRKRKHNLKDIVYQRRKEKSITELMGETMYYLDGEFDSHEDDDIILTSSVAGTKRKASGFLTDDSTAQRSTKTISLAKVSSTAYPNPQKSFKVGDCIRRVASQMTGSSVVIKGCSEESNKKHLGEDADEVSEHPNDALTESTPRPAKESSLDAMLSQLHLSARNPMKGYSFLADIIRFFSEFRNLAVTTQRQKMRKVGSGRKKKSSVPVAGSTENFEFDDRNDSYWTDMVVQNNAEAKPVRRGRKRKDEQVVSCDPQKTAQPNRRKYSRKQYHQDNQELAPEMPTGDGKQLDLPTELMLNFGELGSVPSEVNLNKIFRRFGPLKESETEVDMQSSRARVVFKKRSDAEVAYSSAAMFNIFGSTLVNYQLNYTLSTAFRPSPLSLTDGKEDAT